MHQCSQHFFLNCLQFSFVFLKSCYCWRLWLFAEFAIAAVADFAAYGIWPWILQKQQFRPMLLDWFQTCHCHNSNLNNPNNFVNCLNSCLSFSVNLLSNLLRIPTLSTWSLPVWVGSWSCQRSLVFLGHHWCWRSDYVWRWQMMTGLPICNWSWWLFEILWITFEVCSSWNAKKIRVGNTDYLLTSQKANIDCCS